MSSPDEGPPPLEWHRVDQTGAGRKSLVIAAVLVTGGATFVGAGFVSRLGESLGHTVALAGACTMLIGLVLGVGSALVMAQEDRYLAARVDGVLLHWSREREVLLAWEQIERIEMDRENKAIAFFCAGSTETWNAESGAPELARRLRDLKQKAAHGLLRKGS